MTTDKSSEVKEKRIVTLADVDFDNEQVKQQLAKAIAEILSWPDKD